MVLHGEARLERRRGRCRVVADGGATRQEASPRWCHRDEGEHQRCAPGVRGHLHLEANGVADARSWGELAGRYLRGAIFGPGAYDEWLETVLRVRGGRPPDKRKREEPETT